MDTTSVSLLNRLKGETPDRADWDRLFAIYEPLIRRWIERIPGVADEAPDLVQEVLTVIVRKIAQFERRHEGSFRAWLRQVTVFQVRTHRKRLRQRPVLGRDLAEGFLDQLAEEDGELAREWDLEHDRFVFQKLLAIVSVDFKPVTWEAFRRFVLEAEPLASVALGLGLTENSVLKARARIVKRIREEAGELLD